MEVPNTLSTLADNLSSNISRYRQTDRESRTPSPANTTTHEDPTRNTDNDTESSSSTNANVAAVGQNSIEGNSSSAAHELSNNTPFEDSIKFPQFECKLRNITLIHQLINSIQPFGDDCFIDISSDGICFSLNDGNICKVTLNLNRKLFSDFNFNGLWMGKRDYTRELVYAQDDTFNHLTKGKLDDHISNYFDPDGIITININLSSLLETVNIYAKDNLDCTLRYKRYGDPFELIFEDEYIIEKCEIDTYFYKNPREQQIKKKKAEALTRDKKTKPLNNVVSELEILDFDIERRKDDSVFRLDTNEILYDIIIKSSILHDIVKDMNDLNTDKFILYCKKNSIDDDLTSPANKNNNKFKNSKIMFISKSKSDSIGFSKLIIPQKRLNIPEFKLYKPVETGRNKYAFVDCYNMPLSSTYHFDYFSKLLKAIKLSRLIKIRKDMKGITSLLLLLGKTQDNQNQVNGDLNDLYGSSIEFVILESLSIEELSSFSIENEVKSLLGRLGFSNQFVEQLIKDDQDVQTIRVGDNGRLVTLDDYFGNPGQEFEQIENHHNNINHLEKLDDYTSIEKLTEKAHQNKSVDNNRGKKFINDDNVLKLTEQLTMSLLGHGTSIPNSPPPASIPSDIQVEQTMVEDEPVEHPSSAKRKRASLTKGSSNNLRTRSSKKKKQNDGIETVGGAIEIPLFI